MAERQPRTIKGINENYNKKTANPGKEEKLVRITTLLDSGVQFSTTTTTITKHAKNKKVWKHSKEKKSTENVPEKALMADILDKTLKQPF